MSIVIAKLETEAWKLEVVGKLPALPPFIPLQADTTIEVRGAGQLSAHNRQAGQLELVAPGTLIEPLLFENTDYDFYLELKKGDAKLMLPPTATLRHHLKGVAHHSLNFRNDVGFVELKVESDVTGSTTSRFEVFPIKIDYRRDYTQMRDEVATITRNLVMTAQARTFGAASAAPIKEPTLVEWLALARHYFHGLVAAANAIAHHPHSRLIKDIKSVPVERSRKVDGRALSRLMRRPVTRAGAKLPNTDISLPERVPGIVSRATFDTPENRYVKALLLETRRNLQRLIRTRATGDEDADLTAEEKFFETARPEAEVMLRQTQVLLKAPYLKEVATAPPKRPSSMVFHQHPQYAAFIRIAQLLNGGLAIDGGPMQVGVKQVSLLYEYWCFLKIMKLLAERLDLEQQTLVKVKHLKITVILAKGIESTIRFRDRTTGKKLILIYNRLFNRLPTAGQQPDNVIQLASDDSLYIFDAKYRVAFDATYQKLYSGAGPLVDDINTMHRYRDAIVIPRPTQPGGYQKNIVRGAAVLFPYPDESAYRGHKFYQSLASVEIGGLPFLPQATSLVEEKLREILAGNGYCG